MKTLIKGALVIDGTGTPGKRMDILIKDERIVSAGHFPKHNADQVIDAIGLIATPGFIDINTDSDHYLTLFTDRAQNNFLLQGVTSIIGGHSGSSLAPLIKGSLESIRKWVDINKVNVDWNTVEEFLSVVERLKLGVNFGTFVGHSTIRRGLIGEEHRALTDTELKVFENLLKESLSQGAFGMSTGLRYNHAQFATEKEFQVLVSVLADKGGIYATHLRDEKEKIVEAVDEIIKRTEESKARSLITHFRAMTGYEDKFKIAFDNLVTASKNKFIDIHFDGYPFDYSIIPIYSLLSDDIRKGSIEDMCAVLASSEGKKKVLSELSNLNGDEFIIARASGFDYVVGKSLSEFSKNQELSVSEGLVKLMINTKLKAVLFRKNINLDETIKALFSDIGFIASNSPSMVEEKNVLTNERASHTFSRFLEITEKSKSNSLEWAVNKITKKSAEFLNIKDRGVIAEGMYADIVLLDKNQAVHVFVNGRLAVSHGVFQDIYSGKVLRKEQV